MTNCRSAGSSATPHAVMRSEIAARAAEIDVIGADIDAYGDKVRNVADAGIFGPDLLRRVISDRITAGGVADEPALRQFVIS